MENGMSSSALLAGSEAGSLAVQASEVSAPSVHRQWLDVDGFITDRLLISYRAPADRLRALVPAPFQLDERRGFGFLSVCALHIAGMGLRGSPS